MSFAAYCLRRFVQTLFVFIGVISILFLLFHVVGGDPALVRAGKNADARSIELLRQQMGLHHSLFIQYLNFVKDAFTFNWGTSWAAQRPVMGMIVEGLGPSLSVTLSGFVITFWVSLALAYAAVHFRGEWPEKIVNGTVAFLMSISFIVVILFMQKLFAYTLDWFPIFGWDSGVERWRFVALPCFIYVVGSFAPKYLVFRALIREELDKRYVLTAQSKGVSWFSIYFSHIFKNIFPALITLVSAQIPALLTGSLLLEIYFGIPGVGHLLLKSIQGSDFPVVKGLTIFGSMAYIFFVFAGDLLAHAFLPQGEKS